MEDKLKLLSLADDFNVNKTMIQKDCIEFEITLKDKYYDNYCDEENSYRLSCVLLFNNESKLIKENYYLTGIYNSGVDYGNININQLQKLQEFVELMKGE